jgi:hypothetical protein
MNEYATKDMHKKIYFHRVPLIFPIDAGLPDFFIVQNTKTRKKYQATKNIPNGL